LLLTPTADDTIFVEGVKAEHGVFLGSITGLNLKSFNDKVTQLIAQKISDKVEEIQLVSQSETQSTIVKTRVCPNGDIVLSTQTCQTVIEKEIKEEVVIFLSIEDMIDLSASNLDFRKEVISVTPTEI